MSTIYKQSDFFEPDNQLNSLAFNVGRGTAITGALPEHRSYSGGPDSQGTLAAMGRIRGAKHKHKSSDDIGQLFDWIMADQPPFIHLIGHGSAGLIHVGCAQNSSSFDGTLHTYNHYYWGEHLERTSRYDQEKQEKLPADDLHYSGGLLLEGSCIAEGEEGAKFMKLLADTTLRTVFAYTGLILVKDNQEVLFEKGHVWLRQEPLAKNLYLGGQPTPQGLIGHREAEISKGIAGMEHEALQKIKIYDIACLSFITVEGDIAQLLYSELTGSVAFQQEGHVLGVITHQFDIYFENSVVQAELYSERLLKTSLGVSYFVGPSCIALLTEEIR